MNISSKISLNGQGSLAIFQYIDDQGFSINRELFEKNARYVRTALVAYNAYFSDGSDFSKKEYLERIVLDSLQRND